MRAGQFETLFQSSWLGACSERRETPTRCLISIADAEDVEGVEDEWDALSDEPHEPIGLLHDEVRRESSDRFCVLPWPSEVRELRGDWSVRMDHASSAVCRGDSRSDIQ
jgi:hypothetical protein